MTLAWDRTVINHYEATLPLDELREAWTEDHPAELLPNLDDPDALNGDSGTRLRELLNLNYEEPDHLDDYDLGDQTITSAHIVDPGPPALDR